MKALLQASSRCRTPLRLLALAVELMGLGRVKKTSDLAPHPTQSPRALEAQVRLERTIADWRGPDTLVLVTHGQTIQNLLALKVGEGETVVLKPTPDKGAGYEVIGRIPPP